MEYLEREGFAKLRAGKGPNAVRWIIQRLASVAEDAGEESLEYLVACYRGAKVLAAAGHADGAIKVLNMVPKKASQDPNNAETLSLLALEFGEGLRRLGDAQTAERIVGLAHGLRGELFGLTHPKTGVSSLMAARICFDLERWTDAARFFESSLVALGPHHPFGAVTCADRAYLVCAASQDVFPFPKITLTAPLGYWHRIVDSLVHTTLHVALDLRLAVLLTVSSELQDRVDGAVDLVRPLLVTAYRYASVANDERAVLLHELLEENGWIKDVPSQEQYVDPTMNPKTIGENYENERALAANSNVPVSEDQVDGAQSRYATPLFSPEHGADTQEFWRCPDRDSEHEWGRDDGWFRLYEGVAAMRAGNEIEAKQAFSRVVDKCADTTLEHWAAKGCLRFFERGGELGCGPFNPQPRALEALAVSKMPKTIQAKVQGVELASRDGGMSVTFIGAKLTEAQQVRAMKAVEQALSWILEQTEKAS